MPRTGIIILAAGNSSRLGRPKQLLVYRGTTLIGHLVDEAVGGGLEPIVVVSGAVDLDLALAGRPAKIIVNPRWPEGMGTSIAAGFAAVGEADSVIIAGCDQPYVTSGLFRHMTGMRAQSGKGIVACSYSDTAGIPVLFDRRYFGMLSGLTGQEGAKKVLQSHSADLALVTFPEGAMDIDTEEDVARLSDR